MTREPDHVKLAREAARKNKHKSTNSGKPADNGKPANNGKPADDGIGEPSFWPEPQPLPNGLPPVLPFDYAMLPISCDAFVNDVAERMQCPPDFPAVALMVALATVVGKKIGIRPKRNDDWLVVPNLWGGVVGRPGIMKTPAVRQPFKFCLRLQIEAKKRFEQEMREYEERSLIAEAKKKEQKRAIEAAVKKKQDPLEAARAFGEIEEPEPPTPRRYIVNDSTVEKLGELLNENPNGLGVFRDELIGLLRQLDKEGQESARAFYLESWDGGGTFIYDRIGRGTIPIDSCMLSIFGGIQPGRLFGYLGDAIKGGAGDDGMLQRFQLTVYPDVEKEWRNIDRWPDTHAKQCAWEVFQKLDALDPAAVGAQREDGDDGVPFLHFDHDAQNLFDDWRAKLEQIVRSGDEHPVVESHLAKYRSLVPSLALLIHLAEGGVGPVTAKPTQKALAWVRYLESHARRIFSIVTDPTTAAAKALAQRITKGDVRDGFALWNVYRNGWAGLDKAAAELAAELLIELGWLKQAEVETAGRRKTIYRVNPKILSKTAGEGTAKTEKSPSFSSFSEQSGQFDADDDARGAV